MLGYVSGGVAVGVVQSGAREDIWVETRQLPAYTYTLLSFVIHNLYYHLLYIVLVVLYHPFPSIRMFRIIFDGLVEGRTVLEEVLEWD